MLARLGRYVLVERLNASPFMPAEPQPTEVRRAAPRVGGRLREGLIVAGALLVADALVGGTWVVTRPSEQSRAGSIVIPSSPPQAQVLIDGVKRRRSRPFRWAPAATR